MARSSCIDIIVVPLMSLFLWIYVWIFVSFSCHLPWSLTPDRCMHTFELVQLISNEMKWIKKSRKNNQTIEHRLFFHVVYFLWVLCVYDLISTRQTKSLVKSVLCASSCSCARLHYSITLSFQRRRWRLKWSKFSSEQLSNRTKHFRQTACFSLFSIFFIVSVSERLISDL